jgi:hypothetical protein
VHAAEFFDLLVQARMRPPCSLRLSAISQQYFSLRINQPPATSQLLSQNKPAPVISHQPNERAGGKSYPNSV